MSRKRRQLGVKLEKTRKKAKVWGVLSKMVQRPRRSLPSINLARLSRITSRGEIVAIPGKVLGGGKLDHPLTVAALHFSLSAAKAIEGAGGKVLSLSELAEQRPDGREMRVIV